MKGEKPTLDGVWKEVMRSAFPRTAVTRERAQAIVEAMKLSGSARRMALRQLAQHNLEPIAALSARVMQASPLIGTEPNQLHVSATAASFRDLLCIEALLAVAIGGWQTQAVMKAVLGPKEHGFPSSNKTGYQFGRPTHLPPEAIEKVLSILRNVVSGEQPELPEIEYRKPAVGMLPEGTVVMGKGPMPPEAIEKELEELFMPSNMERIICAFAAVYQKGTAGVTKSAVIDATREAWLETAPASAGDIPRQTFVDVLEGEDEAVPDANVLEDARVVQLIDIMKRKLGLTGDGVSEYVKEEGESVTETKLREPGEHEAKIIDVVLNSQGLPPVREMIKRINSAQARIKELEEEVASSGGVSLTMAAPVEVEAKGEVPKGKVVTMKAWEAMGLERGKEAFDFDVPVWEWEHAHPHVPEKDEDYIFQPFVLLRALYALVTNQRCWIYGHTGTGKSTLVEQICARLQWPMMRVNFDSEITRMDLVGREVLRSDGSTTVSHFEEGILPRAMQQPVVLLMDEMDYIRPDVSYVLQRVTEGSGLLLTEDGGRLVKPHPMFRIMATANTQGQGDEYGMYAGARQQSMAFLDRFTSWIEVQYLSEKERSNLLRKRVPDLNDGLHDQLVRYSGEHIEAFTQGKVMQPLSPRGLIEAGKALAAFWGILPRASRSKAVQEALGSVLLDRAVPQDRAVLRGIVDRVFK